MGLFGFGKKKHHDDDAAREKDAKKARQNAADANDVNDAAADDQKTQQPETAAQAKEQDTLQDAGATAQSQQAQDDEQPDYPTEPSEEYEGRGEDWGPWDVNDEYVPDYDDYLDLGAYYIPFMKGIELRIKAARANKAVLGATITYGTSSLEVEAFAAPKTLGLWDDVRADLLDSKSDVAKEVPGVFGTELILPVPIKEGKMVTTRIVGVDGPRWMLRGIFSGKAATDPDDEETCALNRFFSQIVVERGEEPLAPRDLIPMHAPVTPGERRAAQEQAQQDAAQIPDRPKGPFDSDQQVEQKTTLARGPMFSEVR
ncbi:DUF3710 domain-containing protein [Bifidobacterium thermophilum]|uniref:DUF3710 domain-containing protein n=1 Tax=Bifidobacterium thermophilum TaxID=33905 RepID=UPI0039955483